jgi:hypothetical protein
MMMMKKESKLDEDVFKAYLTAIDRRDGLKFDEAMRILKSQGIMISMDQLVKAVDTLCNEGRLYTTIDDEHYKPTTEE